MFLLVLGMRAFPQAVATKKPSVPVAPMVSIGYIDPKAEDVRSVAPIRVCLAISEVGCATNKRACGRAATCDNGCTRARARAQEPLFKRRVSTSRKRAAGTNERDEFE